MQSLFYPPPLKGLGEDEERCRSVLFEIACCWQKWCQLHLHRLRDVPVLGPVRLLFVVGGGGGGGAGGVKLLLLLAVVIVVVVGELVCVSECPCGSFVTLFTALYHMLHRHVFSLYRSF